MIHNKAVRIISGAEREEVRECVENYIMRGRKVCIYHNLGGPPFGRKTGMER
jgi:hypothetical protein